MAVTYSQNGVIVRQNTVKQVAYTPQQSNSLVIDKNGYIGHTMPAGGTTYYAAVDTAADYSNEGLGQVSVIIPEFGTTVIGGRTYKTVKIGTQTWMAEDLDYKFPGAEFNPSGTPSTPAYFYTNRSSTPPSEYARLLYNWHALRYLEDNKSTLIPGWRVPTSTDYRTLLSVTGTSSIMLKSSKYWSSIGVDAYGFTVNPTGYVDSTTSHFGDYWGSSLLDETSSSYCNNIYFYNNQADAKIEGYYKYSARALRLIKEST